MKVGINISSLHNFNKGRGIGFYTDNLIASLKKYTDIEVEVLTSGNTDKKVDIIHYPFFDFFKPTLKTSKNIPTVVTIHDVIPLLFPKHYPPGLKGKFNLFRQKRALINVSAVITDSETSTSDVKKVLKVPAGKVHTVYLAASDNFKKIKDTDAQEIVKKFNLPQKFALYTGGVNWNKNLINQTEAALNAGIDIVFVGGGFSAKDNLHHPELRSYKLFLEKYENNPKVHILGFVSQEEIVALVNIADVLLFASFYEGFGLPILEAQSCGTPVITSNNSSMKEVAGEGALLVDPEKIDSIEEALQSFQSRKNSLVKKGLENLERFSWEKTAKQTAQIYNDIAR